jgi:hypothetical protein
VGYMGCVFVIVRGFVRLSRPVHKSICLCVRACVRSCACFVDTSALASFSQSASRFRVPSSHACPFPPPLRRSH